MVPKVTTDRPDYLLGSTILIRGSGFGANESVTLQVHRATPRAPVAHPAFEPFTVFADNEGRITSSWVLQDGIGINFLLSAISATTVAPERAEFHRVAVVRTNKGSYEPGATAHVSGSGFSAGAVVNVSMENALLEPPGPVTADLNGQISATFQIDSDPSAVLHRVIARSGNLHTMSGFNSTGIIVVDDGGPNDVPRTIFHSREKDLLYYRFAFRKDVTPRLLDVTIGWNSSWVGAGYNTPTILLDTNSNGLIDLALNQEMEGDPIQAMRTAWLSSCLDTSASGCEQPREIGSVMSWFYATGGAIVQNLAITLTDLGLDPSGEEPRIVNVCNQGFFDCVVTPGNGFLSLEQTVQGGGGTDTFRFQLASGTAQNGASSWSITPKVSKDGVSGSVEYVSMPPGTYVLNELVPAGWKLTSAQCQPGGTGVPSQTLPATGPATVVFQNLVIQPGQLTRCSFAAERPRGR